MRVAVLALATAFGFLTVPAAVQAAPVIGGDATVATPAPVILVAGGCGPGFHPAGWRDRWGHWHPRCVPNHRW
jgi:hypothetical protein